MTDIKMHNVSRRLPDRSTSLSRCMRGMTGMIMAIMVPVLVGFAGLVIDLSYYQYTKQRLEAATDTVALHLAAQASATRVLSARFTTTNSILDDVPTALQMGLSNLSDGNATNAITAADVTIGEWDFGSGTFDDTPPFRVVNAVRVNGELSRDRQNEVPQFFSGLLGAQPVIKSTSYAFVPPVPNIHTLHTSAPNSLSITGRADVDSFDAWVNSSSTRAAIIDTSSFSGWGGSSVFTPGRVALGGTAARYPDFVVENMYILNDLLAGTPDPEFTSCGQVLASGVSGGCALYRYHVVNQPGRDVTLDPGIYKGGLEIRDANSVTLNPGVYVMKDGPFKTSGSTPISGVQVLLNFTGNNARLDHSGSGRLSLRGMDQGPYQGFVVFSDRETTRGHKHEVGAPFDFVGTIYLPTGDLEITAYMNGNCHSLCVVSQTFTTTSLLNIFPGIRAGAAVLGNSVPAPPLSLIPALAPRLVIDLDGP